MVFSSVYFIFIFLPVTLALYYLVPGKLKDIILAAAGLLFYAWGGPSSLIYLLFSVVFNYLAGLQLDYLAKQGDDRSLTIVTAASAGANVLLLALFKYLVHALPLGLSFYTFSALSYLFDIQQGRAEGERNPLRFLLYISFFAKVTSGPIVLFADMKESLEYRSAGKKDLIRGLHLFTIGLAKKVLLADQLGAAFATLNAQPRPTVLGAWLTMIFYSLQLYYDFSGYSDMAIGIARMFGFHFGKNFDHPYLSSTISEFWRRWHISLGNWFKQYVYFPLGGSRTSSGKLLRNLLVVWILTGIWHGNTMNFLFWGLFHGAFVIAERFLFRDRFEGTPRVLRILGTDLIAFIGWIFFYSEGLTDALGRMGSLVGIGAAGLADNLSVFMLLGFFVLLTAAVLGATDIPEKCFASVVYRNRFGLNGNLVAVIGVAVFALLFISSVACMLSSTYSTFLYFQF